MRQHHNEKVGRVSARVCRLRIHAPYFEIGPHQHHVHFVCLLHITIHALHTYFNFNIVRMCLFILPRLCNAAVAAAATDRQDMDIY